MFEREIQFIYDFNQNKVNKLGSFITFEQLENSDVHPAILKYISGEIDFLIFEDRQKLLKESLFDYSGEQISEHFAGISEVIKRTKRFSLNYVEKLILHAASFTINYLARPKWSILKFIFDEEKNKSALEIKQIFNYFYYYPYLHKIIFSYLDKKKVVSISFDEFKSLLEKIDNISLEANHQKVINEALDSMSEFLNIGLSKRKLIPLEAVKHFLAEKSLEPFIAKLERDFDNPDVTRYELTDLRNSLNEVVFEIDGRDVGGDDILELDKPEPVRSGKYDTFGEGTVELPPGEEKVLLDGVPLEETVVPEIEPEDQVLDSVQYPESELDEIDLAEDTRADGEALEDISEVVKEEKEDLELENLQKEEIDYQPQGNLIENDEEDDELIEFEKKENSDIVKEDIDAAKALYMDEVVVEENKETVETVENNDETSIPEETKDEPGAKNEEIFIPEETVDEQVEKEPEEELDEALDEIVSEIEEVAESTTPNLDEQEYEQTFEKDENNETIDSLLDDVEEILEETESFDEVFTEAEKELDTSDLPEFEEFVEENEKEEAESQQKLEDFSKEYKEDFNEEIEEDEEPEKRVNVFDELANSQLLNSQEDINDISNQYEKSDESIEDLKLFNDNDFRDSDILEEEDKNVKDDGLETGKSHPKIDMGELLENKKMNKIIDTIFDYDMEDFANAIEKIAESDNEDTALKIVEDICSTAQVSPTSKEAKLFKSIISEYFEQK